MQYNNTTTKAGIIQRIERYGEYGDGVISGDETLLRQITSDVNDTIYELTSDVILSNDNFDYDDATRSDYPIATTPLVAGQRDYQFDGIAFLKLKRLDITWDGTNWYRATPFDSGSYMEGLGNDDKTDGNFYLTEPKYDAKSAGFWLYPRATADQVAAGAKARIEYKRGYDEYTYDDLTKEPPIDRPFHDLIAIGAALRNPSLSDAQYAKLSARYGERITTASGVQFTGGRLALTQHYGNRNDDFQLIFNPQIEDYS